MSYCSINCYFSKSSFFFSCTYPQSDLAFMANVASITLLAFVFLFAMIVCLTVIVRYLISEEFRQWRQQMRERRAREESEKRERKRKMEEERAAERERRLQEKRVKEATLLRARLARLQDQEGFQLEENPSRTSPAPLAQMEVDV